MGIEVILKIAGVGILISIVNQVLKHIGKEEIATFTTLAGVVIVFVLVLNMITDLFDNIKNIFGLY